MEFLPSISEAPRSRVRIQGTSTGIPQPPGGRVAGDPRNVSEAGARPNVIVNQSRVRHGKLVGERGGARTAANFRVEGSAVISISTFPVSVGHKMQMNTPIDFHHVTAWWPRHPSEDLVRWRERIHQFCDDSGIFSQQELLQGQGLTVWGSGQQIALFKLFFR